MHKRASIRSFVRSSIRFLVGVGCALSFHLSHKLQCHTYWQPSIDKRFNWLFYAILMVLSRHIPHGIEIFELNTVRVIVHLLYNGHILEFSFGRFAIEGSGARLHTYIAYFDVWIMNYELPALVQSCNTRKGKLYHSSKALKFS